MSIFFILKYKDTKFFLFLCVDRFSYHLSIERQLSPNTVASYSAEVASFLEYYKGDARDCVPDDVSAYLASRASDLSKRSQAHVLSALRCYFDYLILEGERKDNPCDKVDAPKLGRYLPEVLSVEEVTAILESVPLNSSTGIRDRAILEVLYGCGLRVSEVCNLRLSAIDADRGFVRIVGKGDKERLVPVGQAAGYEDYAFLNRFGKSLSRISVFNMVKKRALEAGVRKSISPHTFRHTFATHLVENGADLRIVQEMLGHESVLTTEIYTHIDSSTWQAEVLEHHPRK